MNSSATSIDYPALDGTVCKGVYYTPGNVSTTANTSNTTNASNNNAALPIVLVCHAWDGLLQEVHDKAQKLAACGYIAFAIDVYGNGKTETDFSRLEATLGPYMTDRALLLDRMQAAVSAAGTIPGADVSRIGAMGYCFGGTAVLDLARAGGDDLKGVVSFHGGLQGNDLGQNESINASVLVLHGEDDPLVPPQQVAEFKAEMTTRQADWQLVSYSNTMHAFTRPEANNPDFGAVYNARTDRRSWQAMLNFFEEIL